MHYNLHVVNYRKIRSSRAAADEVKWIDLTENEKRYEQSWLHNYRAFVKQSENSDALALQLVAIYLRSLFYFGA